MPSRSWVAFAVGWLWVAPVLAQDGQRLGLAGQAAAKGRAQAHREAIARTGVGLYVGSQSSFAKLDAAAKLKWIEAHRKPGTDPGLPRTTSCIDWALEVVQAAYEGVGRRRDAARIEAAVARGGGKGTALLRALLDRGWVGVYWNPDVKSPSDKDREHTYSAFIATTTKAYYGLRVRHFIRNFRPTSGSSTALDTTGLEKLRATPFWVGVARGGRHVFVGWEGTLSEVHYGNEPDSRSLIDEKPFEKFGWCSGMLVVPPGTWPKATRTGITAAVAR